MPTDDRPHVPTGFATLNDAIGIGGLPRGSITEVAGGEHAWVQGFLYCCIAAAQRQGLKAFYVDADGMFSPVDAKEHRVVVSELLLAQPVSGEDALAVATSAVSLVDLLVVQSTASMTPLAELQGKMGEMELAAPGRMMSFGVKQLLVGRWELGTRRRRSSSAVSCGTVRARMTFPRASTPRGRRPSVTSPTSRSSSDVTATRSGPTSHATASKAWSRSFCCTGCRHKHREGKEFV